MKVAVSLAAIIVVVVVIAMNSAGPPDAGSPAQPIAEAADPVAEVELAPATVSLDFRAGEMEIRGLLTHRPGGPVPDRVWVWAYFLNPAETLDGKPLGGSRSDEPIELVTPFRDGDSVPVTVRGPFHWATTPDVPQKGYYARVSVSAVSAEAARIPARQRDYRLDGAIPVESR